jgi:hypothetical protein
MTRRHLTTAFTMLLLLGVLVGGFVAGAKALFAPLPGGSLAATPSPSPSCFTNDLSKGQKIRSRQVEVSVFNAGSKAGLADQTLAALGKRGFRTGEAGNAPSPVKVRSVQVWTTKRHDAAAGLVALQFGAGTIVKRTDADLGPGVDVVIGDGFRKLAKAPDNIIVRKGQEVCVPTSS